MLSKEQIKNNQRYLFGIDKNLRIQSRLCFIGSNPTRLKIFLLLKKNKELCVTDIAVILSISISAISHQLKTLENLGLVKSFKMGRIVCYRLIKNLKVELLLKNFK